MNKAHYRNLIYKADSYLVPEDYDKETFRERVSLEPSDIAKLKEAYKTLKDISAKIPQARLLKETLPDIEEIIRREVSWTSFHKSLPQKMAKDELDLSSDIQRSLLQAPKGNEPLRPNAGEPA